MIGTAVGIMNELVLYAEARRRYLRETQQRDRILFLHQHPDECNENDLDMFVECDGRQLRHLFDKHPSLRKRFNEFRDTPEYIVGSLIRFTNRAWPHAKIDSSPFINGWHLDLMASKYEAIYRGELDRAIFNVPPASMKSTLGNVFFAAWVWAQDPTKSRALFSYNDSIPFRDRQALSTLIHSDWYQRRWGHRFRVITDSKEWLRNDRGGWFYGGGWRGSGTGYHPDYLFIDDPHKGKDSKSQDSMKQVVSWFSNTVATRGMLRRAAIVIIMQRLSTADLCGRLLAELSHDVIEGDIREAIREDGWEHICLPMFFNPDHRYRCPEDPRTEKGQILWPEALTRLEVLRRMRLMELDGEPNVAAQFDQDPLSMRGVLFEFNSGSFVRWADLPEKLVHGKAIRAWDRAATADGGDYTAGVLMVEYNGLRYVVDVRRVQKSPTDRDNYIERVAKADARRFHNYRVANEVNPGPDGKPAHNDLAARMRKLGIICMAQRATKNKELRAQSVAAAVKYGECRVLTDGDAVEWFDQYETELRLFPSAAHDDQVDATAHAWNALLEWEAGKV